MNFGRISGGVAILVVALFLPGCREGSMSLPFLGGSGEEHVLAVKDPAYPVGWTSTTTRVLEVPEMEVEQVLKGKTTTGSGSLNERSQEIVQVLGQDRRRLTIQYDTTNLKHRLGGEKQVEAVTKGPLVRNFILLERAGDEWRGTLESGVRPHGKQKKSLASMVGRLNFADRLFGYEPKRVGAKWKVSYEEENGRYEERYKLRFDRVEQFQGQQCAVITGTVKIKDHSGSDGTLAKTEADAEITIYRSLEYYITLRTELAGDYTKTLFPRSGARIAMTGPMKVVETAELKVPQAVVPVTVRQ